MTWKDLPLGPAACLEALTKAGYAAYPVGGCVRDLLLGREPEDVDLWGLRRVPSPGRGLL